jgi:DNA invertase Pin-like site-specific DNA recombinase
MLPRGFRDPDAVKLIEMMLRSGKPVKQSTRTPSGKMLFQMLGVFAEFEREIIRERIIAGQQRAQGKQIGRRSVIDESLQAQAVRLKSNGLSLRKIGERLNVSAATVQ